MMVRKKLTDEERILQAAAKRGFTPERPATNRQARKEISPEVQLPCSLVKRTLRNHRMLLVQDTEEQVAVAGN